MQTTLLGLAIAIILALVAALVAPLVVDSNHFRTTFENEASRSPDERACDRNDRRARPADPAIELRDADFGVAGREPLLRAARSILKYGFVRWSA